MQTVARALDRDWSVVPTVSTNNTRVDAVTIPDLDVVIATRVMKLQTQHHELEFNGKGTVHLYGPFTASIVGVTLQNQMALSFPDHAPTLHAVSTRPARATLSTVFATNEEVIPGPPSAIVTALTVFKYTATWMDDAGVALIDSIAAAWHSVANRRPLQRAFTADHIVLTAASAHNVPLWAWAVVV